MAGRTKRSGSACEEERASGRLEGYVLALLLLWRICSERSLEIESGYIISCKRREEFGVM